MSLEQHEHPKRQGITLRMRLTLWVVVIFSLIQFVLTTVYFLYNRSATYAYFDERLTLRADSLAAQLSSEGDRVIDERLVTIAQEETRYVLFEEFLLTIYSPDGEVIASSRRPALLSDRILLAEAIEKGRSRVFKLPLDVIANPADDASAARAVVRAYDGADGRRYELLVATSDTYVQRLLARSLLGVLILALIGMTGAFAAGWFIAGLAVAPIAEVRRLITRLSPYSIGETVSFKNEEPELRRLEEELDGARRRIEAGFRAQERFMSNVSHELKTPIAVLLVEAQTMHLDDAPIELREFVASTRQELSRLGKLVDSFLTLSRVRDGRQATITRTYMVNELVMDSIEHCVGMARQHHVRLIPELLADEETVDLHVAGDPELLSTMMDNLVRNAIRFSPEGAPVDIVAGLEHDRVKLHVRDRGVGISDEIIDRIFDRFAQAPEEARRGRGHGLGLEIAQGIAELHNGSIRVRNLPSGGCEFTVTLPVLSGADAKENGRADDT